MRHTNEIIEILDTTLRDGEQTPGISFKPEEKLQIAKTLLEKLRVDRIEIASARVSEGEREAAGRIIEWAKKKRKADKIEILGFVDKGKSLDWIKSIDGRVVNLLTKGSENHCRQQLRKSPERHFRDVRETIEYAISLDVAVNVYLEDWSGGMRGSLPYVFDFLAMLAELPVKRVMLPDTLGILNPADTRRYLDWLFAAFPDFKYDFHPHNDYGLGTANNLAAAAAGIDGIHVTVNGLGERAGNSSIAETVGVINDMTTRKTGVREIALHDTSQMVQAISGKRLAANAPVVGGDVFTQTCGVHADGDKKGNLYANALAPERFGRQRIYALGKLSGKASIDKNIEALGLELEDEVRDQVLKEVIRLGDKKKKVTPQDLPYIIADVLKQVSEKIIEFTDFTVTTKRGTLPSASIKIRHGDKILEAGAKGDGGYDAVMKAVRKAMRGSGVKIPKLLDYEVRIPPGGKTDALVETTIVWDGGKGAPFTTSAVDSDQIEAAVEATEKMLNIVCGG